MDLPVYTKQKTEDQSPRFLLGGDKRDRTADLLNAIQALSQLSYTPICEPRVPHAQGVY